MNITASVLVLTLHMLISELWIDMPLLLASIADCYRYVFQLNSRLRKYICKSNYLVEISQKNIGTWKMH